MNALKKQERENQAPLRLFADPAALEAYPPMPAPAPLTIAPLAFNPLAFNKAFNQAHAFLREDGLPYPPMPAPAPLTINGVQVFPSDSPPFSIASPFLNPTPFSGVNPFAEQSATPTGSAPLIGKKLPAAKASTPKASTPKKPAATKQPATPKSTPGAPLATVAVGCNRQHNEFDMKSDSDDSHARACYKEDDAPSSTDSDDEESDSSSVTSTEDVAKKEAGKPKMPRITKEERTSVCEWIVKPRADGKMLNGRWIRNGGAKGASMTATSSEVKTSGAYEALSV